MNCAGQIEQASARAPVPPMSKNRRHVIALVGLHGLRRVILHAGERDNPAAGRLDLSLQALKLAPEPELFDLLLDQPLGRFLEALLNFANAEDPRAGLEQTLLNHQP